MKNNGKFGKDQNVESVKYIIQCNIFFHYHQNLEKESSMKTREIFKILKTCLYIYKI